VTKKDEKKEDESDEDETGKKKEVKKAPKKKAKKETKKSLLEKMKEHVLKIHQEILDSKEEAIEVWDKHEKEIEKDIKNLTKTMAKRVGKKPKDPNAPKKNLNSFLLYCADFRAQVKEENPEMKSTEITTELGKMWQKVKAKNGKDYQKYEKQAKKEKEKYEKIMEDYTPPEGFENTKKEKKSPRSKNAYQLWCDDNRKKIESENYPEDWEGDKTKKFGEMSKHMGDAWNAVKDADGKEYKKYKAQAEKLKEELAKGKKKSVKKVEKKGKKKSEKKSKKESDSEKENSDNDD
jgi:hypothetical protein